MWSRRSRNLILILQNDGIVAVISNRTTTQRKKIQNNKKDKYIPMLGKKKNAQNKPKGKKKAEEKK